jgi:hypothetical protein
MPAAIAPDWVEFPRVRIVRIRKAKEMFAFVATLAIVGVDYGLTRAIAVRFLQDLCGAFIANCPRRAAHLAEG